MIKSVVAIKENGSNIKLAGLNALYKIQQKSENLKKNYLSFSKSFCFNSNYLPKREIINF